MYLGAQPQAPEASETSTPTPSATEEVGENQGDVPDKALAEDRTWTGTLALNDVELGITLDGAAAPQAVASTISLASSGFYDGVSCHRLTTSGLFVLQCGDPDGTGSGGPGYSYGPTENAPADGLYTKGMIAMANSGPYTNGSQFFIVFDDSQLSPNYSVIGEVTSGLDELNKQILSKGTADGSQDGAPKVATTITSFEVK
nr:peptidylprolyl isomerase [Lysinibacter cavernae]